MQLIQLIATAVMASYVSAIPTSIKRSNVNSILFIGDDASIENHFVSEEFGGNSVGNERRADVPFKKIKTKIEFESALMEPGFTVAYVYRSRRCIPCNYATDYLLEAVSKHPLTKVIALDSYDLEDIFQKNNVNRLPTFFLFKDGTLVNRLDAPDENEIKDAVAKYSS